jgi:murein DD-endopeptidase MepM/ murein hydrolase activator NlpD
MPATWAAYGVDGNRDGRRDVMDPEDAIPGAARYLKASGAPGDWRGALFAYNHADWYVQQVLDQAERYRATCRTPTDSFSPGTGPLGWPVRGPITSPFGMRWGRLHAGIDIAAPAGTPVHAAERGRVALRGPVSGYGNYLCIQHLPRLTTCYAHLSGYRARLNQIVQRGQVVGLVGCTGRCFGDHLHFEVRLGPPFAQPADPMPHLEGDE